jgi:hypothetical protein
MDDEEPLQSIDSIVAEIESCKQQNNQNLYNTIKKEKYFEKNECNSSSSSICTVLSSSSTSSLQPKTKDSIKIFKLENQKEIFKKIYEDQMNQINQSSSSSIISTLEQKLHIQRKQGRKPKEENIDITNLQKKNRKKWPSSNLSNSSFNELSSPSSSRKNSADLSTGFKLKKISNKNSVILFLKTKKTSNFKIT